MQVLSGFLDLCHPRAQLKSIERGEISQAYDRTFPQDTGQLYLLLSRGKFSHGAAPENRLANSAPLPVGFSANGGRGLSEECPGGGDTLCREEGPGPDQSSVQRHSSHLQSGASAHFSAPISCAL